MISASFCSARNQTTSVSLRQWRRDFPSLIISVTPPTTHTSVGISSPVTLRYNDISRIWKAVWNVSRRMSITMGTDRLSLTPSMISLFASPSTSKKPSTPLLASQNTIPPTTLSSSLLKIMLLTPIGTAAPTQVQDAQHSLPHLRQQATFDHGRRPFTHLQNSC